MKNIKKYIVAVIFFILVFILVSIWASYNVLQVTHFEYKTPKLHEELEMVILSDLHDHEFGVSNSRLISKVEETEPDIILILGDMLNDISKSSQVAVDLIKQLNQVAPVYYALGNQEIDYMERQGDVLLSELEAAGAVILEQKSQDLEVKGQKIRIGGMYDYAFAMDGNASTIPDHMEPEIYSFLTDFQNTDNFKLMLSHRPDAFVLGDSPKTWEIDLVLSGHAHGGQVILPFLGGLWAGDLGWFSEYVYGLHQLEKFDILISRGLGSNQQKLPRFNNLPEVMVLTLMPER